MYYKSIQIKIEQKNERARFAFNIGKMRGKDDEFYLAIYDLKTGHLASSKRIKILQQVVEKYNNKLESGCFYLKQCGFLGLSEEECEDIKKLLSDIKMKKSEKANNEDVEYNPTVLKKASEYNNDLGVKAFQKVHYNKPYKQFIEKNKDKIDPYYVWFNLLQWGKPDKFERAYGEELPLIMEVYKMYQAYTEDKLEEYFKNFVMERVGKTDLDVLREVGREMTNNVVEYIKTNRKGEYNIEDIKKTVSDEVFERTRSADQKMYQEIKKGGIIYKKYLQELTDELKMKYMQFQGKP